MIPECFICGSPDICKHREVELRGWMRREFAAAAAIARRNEREAELAKPLDWPAEYNPKPPASQRGPGGLDPLVHRLKYRDGVMVDVSREDAA